MTAKKPRPPHIEGYAVSYTTYVNHRCRCEGCAADHRRKHKEWRDNASPEMRRKLYKRVEDRKRRINEQQSRTMPNRSKPWTDEDRAVALNPKLSAQQAANILGRTMFSVKQYRAQHRKKMRGE
jgi:hypothetical protein